MSSFGSNKQFRSQDNENYTHKPTPVIAVAQQKQPVKPSKTNSGKCNNDSTSTIYEPAKRPPKADIARFMAMTTPEILEKVRAEQEKRWAEDKIRNEEFLKMFGIEIVT
jgi:hypothetical protein